MFDHEYTLVAHPRFRARVSYRTDDDGLTAGTLRLDYRGDGDWTEEGTAVSLPEHPDEAGIQWEGFRLALYRDGDRVVARDAPSSLVSNLGDAADAVESYAPSVASAGKRAVERVARRSDRVEMRQPDGSTIEALEPPAKAAFEVYEGRDDKWRWRLVHDNGNVIADSGQGYASKRGAEKGLRSVKRNALGAPVEAVGGDTYRDVVTSSDEDSGASPTDAGSETATDAGSESGTNADSEAGTETGSAES